MVEHVAKPIDGAQLRAVIARQLPAAAPWPDAFEAPLFERLTFEHIAATGVGDGSVNRDAIALILRIQDETL